MTKTEQLLYYKESPYQKIAFFTEIDGSFSLTLDDYWQFNSKVEHIYHECLFTLPGLFPKKLKNVLILGGGDGLGARELLKYKEVENIDLVDLDPEIVDFAKKNIYMRKLNKNSFNDPKVNIIVSDAKEWLAKKPITLYDLIIIDFPDPTSEELWELYTAKIYKQIKQRLTKQGVVSIQATIYNAPTFDKIFQNLNKVFPFIIGHHTYAPNILCGFFICSNKPIKSSRNLPKKCKWLSSTLVDQILSLPLIKVAKETCFGEEQFFRTEEIIGEELLKQEDTFKILLSKPLVIWGLVMTFSTPLILKLLGK